nr:Transposon, En/Spm-like protein [Ipomoea batatas]
MYPIERYLRTLKSYVRNKARPEGCKKRTEGVQECMHFCSRYLHGSKTTLNRVGRNYEGSDTSSHSGLQVFSQASKPLLGKKYAELTLTKWAEARKYVLENCEEVTEFANMHKEILMSDDPRNVEKRQKTEFYLWFKKYVNELHNEGSEIATDQLLHLAYGLDRRIYRYKSILVNGRRFNTKDRDLQLKS